jgi:hypothetical protein
MASEDLLTLVCPPRAEQGPVSDGDVGYRAYLADYRAPVSPWLVDVRCEVAYHIMRAGFRIWP